MERRDWISGREKIAHRFVAQMRPILRDSIRYHVDHKGMSPVQAHQEALRETKELMTLMQKDLKHELADAWIEEKEERGWT